MYCQEFGWIHVYFSILDYKPQVLHLHLVKGAFGQLEVEVLFLHLLKSTFGSFLAFLPHFSKHKDIICVDDEPSFSNHISEGGVHENMECWRGFALSEEHHQWFIQAIRSDEHSLPLVPFFDSDIVVPSLDIHLGEVFGSFQLVNKGRD